MKKERFAFLLMAVVALLLSGCADVETVSECVIGKEYGFWNGLWHGIVTPISWLGCLLSDHIAIYAVNNNGGWYDFGFALGIGALAGGASRS